MIIIPWEIALTYGLTLFGLGFGLGVIPFILAIAREPKDGPNSALSVPADDADTVSKANDAVQQIYEIYWQAFKAIPGDDRLSNKGAQIAYVSTAFGRRMSY